MTALSVLLRSSIACICISAGAADVASPAQAIGVDESVAGVSQADWSQAWLQWIASFPRDRSPLTDTTGAMCNARQDGDVWLLASSDGTAPAVRACAIPHAKILFIPLASTSEASSGNREPDCPAMAQIAAQSIEVQVDDLALVVDGIPVTDLRTHRLATDGCFSPGLRRTPRTTALTAVGDGYYVMLKPLAPGKHTIAFGARFGAVKLSTTYTLDVL